MRQLPEDRFSFAETFYTFTVMMLEDVIAVQSTQWPGSPGLICRRGAAREAGVQTADASATPLNNRKVRGLFAGDRAVGHRGFTLLEMLIAMFLTGVLLTALWTLLHIYSRLFETGFALAEQSNLVRALVDQLAADLQHAIQDPVAGIPQRQTGPTPVRRFGLYGTSTELRVDILQSDAATPAMPDPVGEEVIQVSTSPGSGLQLPRVPELRTVEYRFRPPFSNDESTEDTPSDSSPTAHRRFVDSLPGLLRWEVDYETPHRSEEETPTASNAAEISSAGSTSTAGGEPSSFNRASFFEDLPGLMQQVSAGLGTGALYLPEVTEFQLRYFDGRGWSSSWDSLSRRALPVAIEVTFRITPLEKLQAAAIRKSGEAVSAGSEWSEISSSVSENVSENSTLPGKVYRLVIDIPGSPNHPAPRSLRRESERSVLPPRIERPPVPVSVPLVRPIAPERPRSQPDQWMRATP